MSHFLSPGPQVLLNAQTVQDTAGVLFIGGLAERVTIVLQSTGTTSTGVITLEEAYYPVPETPYGGTWSTLTTVNASTFSGGKQVVIHIVNYSIWSLRVRISTVIGGGGSVTATAWAN